MKLSPEERDAQLDIIKEAVDKLDQHFDTIQVVATFDMKENGTTIFNFGKGNWFARYGSVKAWIKNEEAQGVFDNKDELEE